MKKVKRYHPFVILQDLWGLFKATFFIFLYLFLIKIASDSAIIKASRWGFVILIICSIGYIILKWLTTKYELDQHTFYMYKGVFIRKKQTVPFSKIQNVNRRTTIFHKLFNITSIRFETGMAGEDDAVIFPAVTKKEADLLEATVSGGEEEISSVFQDVANESDKQGVDSLRIIHFQPTKKDILKASFTSFSFFLIIPVIGSLYAKAEDFLDIEKRAKGIALTVLDSLWLTVLMIVFFLTAGIIFGLVRTYLKYGRYEISSDSERIYIKKGIVDETEFSITKERVQGIVFSQSLLKRVLGIVEVKLISAGGLGEEVEELDTNSLYPFLPVKKAYDLLLELLPEYHLTDDLHRLPARSLWIRLLRPSWIWIIGTAALMYFKPQFLGFHFPWIVLSGGLLAAILIVRVCDFLLTGYTLNGKLIQMKQGFLYSNLFISKRDKVIEIQTTQTIIQRWLGLASLTTINRGKPIYFNQLEDVPEEMANMFMNWYVKRSDEVEMVHSAKED